MALIYSDKAIVAVGMSCQAAEQLYMSKAAIDEQLGEVSEQRHTPLDWLIARPAAAAALLDSGRFVPETVQDLRRKGKRFRWRGIGAWFWHEPLATRDFDGLRAKFVHMTQTLENLKSRRILALWTNAQANLAGVSQRYGNTSPIVGRADLAQLDAAIHRYFDNAGFWPIVAADRITPEDPLETDRFAVINCADDDPEDWRGNAERWRPLLAQAVARHLQDPAQEQKG